GLMIAMRYCAALNTLRPSSSAPSAVSGKPHDFSTLADGSMPTPNGLNSWIFFLRRSDNESIEEARGSGLENCTVSGRSGNLRDALLERTATRRSAVSPYPQALRKRSAPASAQCSSEHHELST